MDIPDLSSLFIFYSDIVDFDFFFVGILCKAKLSRANYKSALQFKGILGGNYKLNSFKRADLLQRIRFFFSLTCKIKCCFTIQKKTFWRDPFINSSTKTNIQMVKTSPAPRPKNNIIIIIITPVYDYDRIQPLSKTCEAIRKFSNFIIVNFVNFCFCYLLVPKNQSFARGKRNFSVLGGFFGAISMPL